MENQNKNSIVEIHREMIRKGARVPQGLESFLDIIDDAVRKKGEGMKIAGGTPRELGIRCISGVRFEAFNEYLHYLAVGEDNYRHWLSMLAGEQWNDWAKLHFRYIPEVCQSERLKFLFKEER